MRSTWNTSGGEDVTETLELIPRRWKVVQTVREKFACRTCETIIQPPAPFHPIARGRAGPELLATILDAKFAQHLPLNRQSETFSREGIELDTSTLADWVGACTATLSPLIALIRAHVLASERLHGDDTTVPVLARGKTTIGRLWTYVRDDRPFAGPAPPAALFHYSPDRRGEHPQRHPAAYAGILQADAYAGFGELYHPARKIGPVTEAGCWAELPKVPRAKHVEWQRRAMVGASCSIWLSSPRHRSRLRRCGGSTRSLTLSGPSTACLPSSAWPCGRTRWRHSWRSWRAGYGVLGPGCRDMLTSEKPWTICSSAGTRSAGSCKTAGSASATMRQSGPCAAWP